MAPKVKPLSDRVVVEPAPAEDVSSGGIILPDTAQEKPQQGTVVAAGPGKASDSGKTVAMDLDCPKFLNSRQFQSRLHWFGSRSKDRNARFPRSESPCMHHTRRVRILRGFQ